MVHGWAGTGGGALAASQHGRLEFRVTAGVLDQVVAAHEALITQWAQEAFLPCVGAGVAGELIRAGKFLLTVRPGAREGSLTCNMEAEKKGEPFTTLLFTNSLNLKSTGKHASISLMTKICHQYLGEDRHRFLPSPSATSLIVIL